MLSNFVVRLRLSLLGALIVLGAPSFNLRRAIGIFGCVAILLFPNQMLPVFGLRDVAAEHRSMRQAVRAVLRGSDNSETLNIPYTGQSNLIRHVVRRQRGTKISIFADRP